MSEEWLSSGSRPADREKTCGSAVVYIEACCRHEKKPPPVVRAERNGRPPSVSVEEITQLLPQVEKKAPKVATLEPAKVSTRHRDDGGINMSDLTLGALIGAGTAVFLLGLLMVLLFR